MNSFIDFKINKSSILYQFTTYRFVVLFFGLAIWLFVPIIGIFPLLFYLQLNILKNPNKQKFLFNFNNFLLILILLTVVIYLSSFEIFGDTIIYIQDYLRLGKTGPFQTEYGAGLEFVMLALAYPTYLLSNGSSFWFLFNHSLIINILSVFIARNFSKKYYPLILIFVFSASLYYSQVFYMRQFLSNILLLAAISAINSKKFFLYLPWNIFAHLSNIFPSIMIIIVKLDFQYFKLYDKFLRRKKYKIILSFLLIVGLIVIIQLLRNYGSQVVISLLSPIINIQGPVLGGDASDYLQYRVDRYDSSLATEAFELPIMSVVDALVLGGIAILGKFPKNNKTNQIIICLIGLYFINLFSLIFVVITGFNWRISLMFLSLSGFFYLIGLEVKNRRIQTTVILLSILKVFYFIYFLLKMNPNSYFVFFEGYPLEMTAYDYLVYFFNAIST